MKSKATIKEFEKALKSKAYKMEVIEWGEGLTQVNLYKCNWFTKELVFQKIGNTIYKVG